MSCDTQYLRLEENSGQGEGRWGFCSWCNDAYKESYTRRCEVGTQEDMIVALSQWFCLYCCHCDAFWIIQYQELMPDSENNTKLSRKQLLMIAQHGTHSLGWWGRKLCSVIWLSVTRFHLGSSGKKYRKPSKVKVESLKVPGILWGIGSSGPFGPLDPRA